jgi:hypothetical protein
MQYVRAYGVGVDRRCDREEDYTPVSRVVAFRHKKHWWHHIDGSTDRPPHDGARSAMSD